MATAADARLRDSRVDEHGRYAPFDYWLSTCGLYDFYEAAIAELGELAGRTLVDCGCGPGHTAIMFARRGARVSAFDVDPANVELAQALCAANDVAVDVSRRDFERTGYADASFDLAFGSCVVHHVDVERAAVELGRILKPGGRAVFIENSARNPLLMLARRFVVGSCGIPKYGDDAEEHPLRRDELRRLARAFAGEVRVRFPSLVLFRLVDFYVTRRRWRWASRLLSGLDGLFGRVPGARRFGYFQLIVFEKRA
jgi:SAM-dependent methyltransferase